MPRTGVSTTRATQLSRARGAGTQKRTAVSATQRTAAAGGQWRIIEGKSGSMEFSERHGEWICGVILVFLYMAFMLAGA
jgi:hypothetical protein